MLKLLYVLCLLLPVSSNKFCLKREIYGSVEKLGLEIAPGVTSDLSVITADIHRKHKLAVATIGKACVVSSLLGEWVLVRRHHADRGLRVKVSAFLLQLDLPFSLLALPLLPG